MNKKWSKPEIHVVSLSETANSNQPDTPSDELWYDYYTECTTCS